MLPKPGSHVVFRRVGDGGVLLSLEDEVYYGLNGVGARIWELLPPQSEDFESLVEKLAREYRHVSPAVIAEDASHLLRDLERNGLVRVDPFET